MLGLWASYLIPPFHLLLLPKNSPPNKAVAYKCAPLTLPVGALRLRQASGETDMNAYHYSKGKHKGS